ncbi:SUF system NifU family Fe-S cluster assembly protein [Planctomycetota bacterium]|nr:SUF system NifU family Fe-S cluster assembly protein [Planctomycetota bacterium]
MDDMLRELYLEMIKDHSKSPRNFGQVAEPNRRASGHNPLCGDAIRLTAQVDEAGAIVDVKFEDDGKKNCAISTASASLMTQAIKGKPRIEFDNLFQRMSDLLTGKLEGQDTSDLEKLEVLQGVRNFPNRVKCASLAWHTLRAALDGTDEATTE